MFFGFIHTRLKVARSSAGGSRCAATQVTEHFWSCDGTHPTPLLERKINAATGAKLLDVAQVTQRLVFSLVFSLVSFFCTATREEHGRVLPGSSFYPQIRGSMSHSHCLPIAGFTIKYEGFFWSVRKGLYRALFGSQSGVCYESEGIIGPPYRSPVVDSLSAVCLALICIDGNGTVGHSCFTLCEHFDSD